jgi:hypothetical protein
MSLLNPTKTLHTIENIETLTDLSKAIGALMRQSPVTSSEVFFEVPATLQLIEELLSDGSKVYNIRVGIED